MQSNIWFTSDTHFGHRNIIDYSNRPFRKSYYPYESDLDMMNRELTRLWNERVKPFDTVYHLGDFAMGKKDMIGTYRSKLNGKIILVKGNHDRSAQFMKQHGFEEVLDELWIKIDDNNVWMRHKPPTGEEISKLHRPVDYVLHGHVHELWKAKTVNGKELINVGVDQWNYQPQSFTELLLGTMRVCLP